MNGWVIHTRDAPWARDIDVLIQHEDRAGTSSFVTGLIMTAVTQYEPVPDDAWAAVRAGGGHAFLQAAPTHWSEILGVSRAATLDEIQKAYRDRAKVRHPDRGGSQELMAELNSAREAAERAIANGGR